MAEIQDWISRVTIPDMYPRLDDPYRPFRGIAPETAPYGSQIPPAPIDPAVAEITTPGSRPVVYQRALSFALTAGVTPVPLVGIRTDCDAILVDVPSTALNSVFFGYSNTINTASGIEVRAGTPFVMQADNTREQWELQRLFEYMAALMGFRENSPALPTYRAPRVAFDASQWFVVAAASTAISVTLFYIPEQQ